MHLSAGYEILEMGTQELATAVDWAHAEGWNPGVNDVAAFYAADPTGFLAGKYRGAHVASISAVKYAPNFGFIGLYIVKPAFRGQGLGFRLWEAALARLKGRCVGLDGVIEQQENYKKSGFRLAHRNIRYAGRARHEIPDPHIVPVKEIDIEALVEMDQQYFPAERRTFIKNWVSAKIGTTLVFYDGGKLLGYGTIRECAEGFKVGPLNAERPQVADVLLLGLMASVPEDSAVFLDLPEPNQNATALAGRFGMRPVFETARMYANGSPKLPLNNIYGITSFELG